MKLRLPNDVKRIINQLETHGYEAYAVGGCVRDLLLGREPKDYDVTTSARPEEVKRIFRRTVDTGIEHGTVTVLLDRVPYEVTTYRVDGAYTDSRHPESVTFTPDLREDLLRRDFTINAMAYNDRDGLIDLFGGEKDLAAGIIRAVGDPFARFTEDALRIMRCVRFAAQLGFSVEPETFAAARALSGNLSKISRERVRDELLKLLLSDHPEKLEDLLLIGAMDEVSPEFTCAVYAECGGFDGMLRPETLKDSAFLQSVVQKLGRMEKDPVLRLSVLFEGLGASGEESGEIADRTLQALRLDNATRRAVERIVSFSDRRIGGDPRAVRFAANEIGPEYFGRFLRFIEDDEAAEAYVGIVLRGECLTQKDLKIGGNELAELGMKPGREMGEVLKALLEIVLEDPAENTKERLLAHAKALSGR